MPIPAGISSTSRCSSGANASVPNTVTSATNGTTVAYVRSGRCPAARSAVASAATERQPHPKTRRTARGTRLPSASAAIPPSPAIAR